MEDETQTLLPQHSQQVDHTAAAAAAVDDVDVGSDKEGGILTSRWTETDGRTRCLKLLSQLQYQLKLTR